MRKNKLLLASMVVFGLFLVVNIVSASTTVDQLQPASSITYNEELVVNSTARFDSIYVGKQNEGGVTFFNGTIINNTTTNGNDNPVTFGDNVRIDGILFRTEQGGNNPLKIGDTLRPESSKLDIGTSTNKWRNGYFSGNLVAQKVDVNGNIVVSGTVDGVDISMIPSVYVSKASPSWDVRTGYASISASSCHPEENSIGYAYKSFGRAFYPTSDPGTPPPGIGFYCSVQLPNGAIITSVEAYVSDEGTGSIIASFYSADLENFNVDVPRTESTIGLGSGDLIINLDSINEIIDNNKKAYYLGINFSNTGTDYDFHGAVVNYTYTEPY